MRKILAQPSSNFCSGFVIGGRGKLVIFELLVTAVEIRKMTATEIKPASVWQYCNFHLKYRICNFQVAPFLFSVAQKSWIRQKFEAWGKFVSKCARINMRPSKIDKLLGCKARSPMYVLNSLWLQHFSTSRTIRRRSYAFELFLLSQFLFLSLRELFMYMQFVVVIYKTLARRGFSLIRSQSVSVRPS